MAAIYFYLRWVESNVWKWLLYSGAFVSCVVVLKINFSLLLLPFILDFIARTRRDKRRLVELAAIWILPLLVHVFVWVSYFMPRDLLRQLWIATVAFNGKYLRAGWKGNISGQTVFLAILGVGMLFFVPALIISWQQRRQKTAALALRLGGTALLFGVILGTFYPYYYLVIIPYLALLCGLYWRQILSSRLAVGLLLLSSLLSVGVSSKQLVNSFRGAAAADAKRMSAAADYVHDHTQASDTIVYYGYGATFYRLAQRDSGSRFISASHPLLDERENFGYGFDSQFIGDMGVTKSKYLIINKDTKDLYAENQPVMAYFNHYYYLEANLPGYEIWRYGK